MKNLTMKEKLRLLVADTYWSTNTANGKLPAITVTDGPCGVRSSGDLHVITKDKKAQAICYPSPHVIANSWDREVARDTGKALASDCIERDKDILLAPGVNIKRTPLCGRNFEYFSEDPYLTGVLAAEMIKGCQGMGVGTSLKHFCANNREYDRLYQSSEVDLRTLREIYTRAFEIILEEVSPYTVMCSYNALNGINMSENVWALKGILRGELGYDGVIISDWESVHSRTEALYASLDIMFPFEQRGVDDLEKSYAEGKISDGQIEESATRILKLMEQVEKDRKTRKAMPIEEREKIALDGARKGMVLLKNEGGVLPLKAKSIAVLGNDLTCVGGGAAQTVLRTDKIRSVAVELKDRLPDAEISSYWLYSHGSCHITPANVRIMNIRRAYDMAQMADVTVLTVGNSDIIETESYDRTTLKLPDALEDVILKIAERAKKLVVLLGTGSAVDVSAWIDKVDAVLYTGFAGEQINAAVADILVGNVCPSGRLSETFPRCVEDTPTGLERGDGYSERYKEGVLVGYRWYDTKKISTQFPFGYGLSYAKFVYSDFSVKKQANAVYEISFKIKNVSEVDGGEVAQLYVRNVDKCVERPEKELRRFEKVHLKAGEEKLVTFTTDKNCFAYFNVCYNAWTVERGYAQLLVCRDAESIEFAETVKLEVD